MNPDPSAAKQELHSRDGDSWTRWVHQVRALEFEGMIGRVPLGADAAVLELGSGDGFQLGLLRARFRRVFAIDPGRRPDGLEVAISPDQHHPAAGGTVPPHLRREASAEAGGAPAGAGLTPGATVAIAAQGPNDAAIGGFCFAVAEHLPFPDSTFDLVVSNCVLEHLENRRRGLDEMVRVLKPGGFAAHVVPSRFWKVASVLFNPLGYPLRVIEKWWAARRYPNSLPSTGLNRAATRPSVGQVLGRWFYPPIHGTYRSHRAEYVEYGRKQWLESLRHPRLVHVADAPLVCATQFGFVRFRFIAARKWLGRHGLDVSRVIVMQKVG
jgi:SAM-dependent methyltransferase